MPTYARGVHITSSTNRCVIRLHNYQFYISLPMDKKMYKSCHSVTSTPDPFNRPVSILVEEGFNHMRLQCCSIRDVPIFFRMITENMCSKKSHDVSYRVS